MTHQLSKATVRRAQAISPRKRRRRRSLRLRSDWRERERRKKRVDPVSKGRGHQVREEKEEDIIWAECMPQPFRPIKGHCIVAKHAAMRGGWIDATRPESTPWSTLFGSIHPLESMYVKKINSQSTNLNGSFFLLRGSKPVD